MGNARWQATGRIAKSEPERQLVFGWLSMALDERGHPIIDHEGDIIPAAELEAAAYDFVLHSRVAGENHEVIGIGRLVESFMATPEKAKAMGIPDGVLPQSGWWVGFRIDDPDVWAKITSGEYQAFSIGGSAAREEM